METIRQNNKILPVKFTFLVGLVFLCAFFMLNVTGLALGSALTGEDYTGFPSGITPGEAAKFTGGIHDGQNIWLVPCNSAMVVKVNLKIGSMTGFNGWPDGFNGNAKYKFRSGVYDGKGGLWLVPYHADRVIRVDTATGAMTGFDAWPDGISKTETAKFVGGVYYNGGVYMVPAGAQQVVKIDTATGVMTGYNNFPSGLGLAGIKFSGGLLRDGQLWMIPFNANMVVKMDLPTGQMTGYSGFPSGIGANDSEKFMGGVLDNSGGLWLVPNNARQLVRLNTATGAMTGFDGFPGAVPAGQSNKFFGGAFDGTSLWLAPHDANSLVRVDISTGQMTAAAALNGSPGKASGLIYADSALWLLPYNADRVTRFGDAPRLSLTANTAHKVFGGTVEIKAAGSIKKLEYFCLNTTDSRAAGDNFAALYAGAAANGVSDSNIIAAKTNGIYWVRATFTDGTTAIADIKIDNIYTPCLYIKGTADGRELYPESMADSQGLPLELDGTLVKSPSLGFVSATITAKDVPGYRVASAQAKTIILDNILYKTRPNNMVEFFYTADNLGGTNPINPGTPSQPKPEKPVTQVPQPEKPAPDKPPALPEMPNLLAPEIGLPGLPVSPSPAEPAPKTQTQADPETPATQVQNAPETPDPIPVERIDPATNQRMVTYTLANIEYKQTQAGYDFRITDTPGDGLQFISGTIPAFTNGSGLTYTILYKTTPDGLNQVLARNIPADAPYFFENTTHRAWAQISLDFSSVPPGFAQGNQIEYTFLVLVPGYSNDYRTTWQSTVDALEQKLSTLRDRIDRLVVAVTGLENTPEIQQLLIRAAKLLGSEYPDAVEVEMIIAELDGAIAAQTAGAQVENPSNFGILFIILGTVLTLFTILLLIFKRKKKKSQDE